MKADEIRHKTVEVEAVVRTIPNLSIERASLIYDAAKVDMLIELTAQFAEANEHLAKIANPLITVEVPRWVWFKYNTFRYVVDAREVASISVPDPTHCVIIMRNEGGSDPGRFCDGTFEEVCAKLGIPTDDERPIMDTRHHNGM